MAEEMIRIENVTYEYNSYNSTGEEDTLTAIKDINISIRKANISNSWT